MNNTLIQLLIKYESLSSHDKSLFSQVINSSRTHSPQPFFPDSIKTPETGLGRTTGTLICGSKETTQPLSQMFGEKYAT